MSFGDDEDILQDFLVEAGEIIERLSQQLVDLEQRPDDTNLLNAIFRGFHTVKGGAGFLALTPMVECCHLTENLFDILRNGKRKVTPELMDVVLKALDDVHTQFQIVTARGELPPVNPALIAALERLVSCADLEEDVTQSNIANQNNTVAKPTAATIAQEDDQQGDITDDEFEQLLNAINGVSPANDKKITPVVAETGSDDISEDEFEALLDQLHGKGKSPSAINSATNGVTNSEKNAAKKIIKPAQEKSVSATPVPVPITASVKATSLSSNSSSSSALSTNTENASDDISDDEFEALLDQLHGKGKGPGQETLKEINKTLSEKSQSVEYSLPTAKGSPVPPAGNSDADIINEDEFELLLDQLHGKGKAPGVTAGKPPLSNASKAMPKPVVNTEPVTIKSKMEIANAEPAKVPASVMAPPLLDRDTQQGVETTVRVDTQRLDDIMNMVGELVLVRNRLVRLGNTSGNEALVKAVANLDVVTADLQMSVMKTRMQPIKKVFGRFPRVVRDLARSLKKEINLELIGEETDLDKNLVEALADPLVHLVRNSVDHGIEFPDVRAANSKSRVGQVVLSAEQEGDHILLCISDDGAGMDPAKLRRVAVEKGLYDEDGAARLSDIEAFNLIFVPGFSTKKEISDVSGRGVGMDVVKTKINQLNGTVEIESALGKGTRFIIKVPLTLAIMPTLMIMVGKQTFALPLISVNEIFHMDLSKSHVVHGQDCIAIRDQAIPLFYLQDWLVKNAGSHARDEFAHVVIVTVGTRRVGFVVDQLIGQEEVVIKPLGKMLQGTPGMAGATITGDGTIALILDIPSLLRRYARGTTSWGHT
jgi:two-component system, chemotaxis family, sensor kinase CheA